MANLEGITLSEIAEGRLVLARSVTPSVVAGLQPKLSALGGLEAPLTVTLHVMNIGLENHVTFAVTGAGRVENA